MKCQIFIALAAVVVSALGAPQGRLWPLQFIFSAGKPGEKLSLDEGGAEPSPFGSSVPIEQDVPVSDQTAPLEDGTSNLSAAEPISLDEPVKSTIQTDTDSDKLNTLKMLWRSASKDAAAIPSLFDFLSMLTTDNIPTQEEPVQQAAEEQSVFVAVPSMDVAVPPMEVVVPPVEEVLEEEYSTTVISTIQEASHVGAVEEQPILNQSPPVATEQVLEPVNPEIQDQSAVDQSIPNTFEVPPKKEVSLINTKERNHDLEEMMLASFDPKKSFTKSKLLRFNELNTKKGKTLIPEEVPQEPIGQAVPFKFPSYSYSFRHVPVHHGGR